MQKTGKGALPRVVRAIDSVTDFTGLLGGLFILAAALVIGEAIFVRKVLAESTHWQNELAIYLLMAAAVIGAAFTQKHEGHIGVDLVTAHLHSKGRRIIDIVGSVVGLVVAVVVAYYAWKLWWGALQANEHSETLWGPPLAIPYSALPLGMTLLALQYLIRIGRQVAQLRARSREAGPQPPDEIDTEREGA
jgi:TRAP-type C4-dicarboxylate transport system permease small subunit